MKYQKISILNILHSFIVIKGMKNIKTNKKLRKLVTIEFMSMIFVLIYAWPAQTLSNN